MKERSFSPTEPAKPKRRVIVLGPPGDLRTHTLTSGRMHEIPRAAAVDFSAFKEKAGMIKRIYASLERWLAIPYVKDTFKTHPERRAREAHLETFDKTYKPDLEIHSTTKLSNNKLALGMSTLELLQEHLEGYAPLKTRIDEILVAQPTMSEIRTRAHLNESHPSARRLLAMQVEEKVIQVLNAVASFQIR